MVRRVLPDTPQGSLSLDVKPPAATSSSSPTMSTTAPATAPPTASKPEPKPGDRGAPLKVGQLVRAAHKLVEEVLGFVWLEGEVSGLKQPASGHLYFSMKDDDAQVPAVMWRSAAQRLRFRVEDGARVLVRGRLGVYPEQGKLQLYVEQIEPAGAGAAALAFEQLKARLAAEGLFAEARKRPLPRWPKRIGLVTSPTGAAVRDIIRVIERRCPTRILISPTRVQGEGAGAEIAQALRRLAGVADIDVVIIGRGGGSSEDLSAFNDEAVVRAIAAHPVPVVSAVGHEVDITLSDLVADLRAATPTAAGELCVPDRDAMARDLVNAHTRLARAFSHRLVSQRSELERLVSRLPAPAVQLGRARQRLDELMTRARASTLEQVSTRRRTLAALDLRRAAAHPRARLQSSAQGLTELTQRARVAMAAVLTTRKRVLEHAAGKLQAMSPLAVLERGYAVARTTEGAVVTDADTVRAGDALELKLRHGTLDVTVVGPRKTMAKDES